MQMIFQDPMACLNPRKKVADIIGEGLDINHLCKNEEERNAKIARILEKVGLAPEKACATAPVLRRTETARRIARALIMNPKLIIADECISALGVSIQAQVVNLMRDIQEETGSSYLYIAMTFDGQIYLRSYRRAASWPLVETARRTRSLRTRSTRIRRAALRDPHPNPRNRAGTHRPDLQLLYERHRLPLRKAPDRGGHPQVLATPEEFETWTSTPFEYQNKTGSTSPEHPCSGDFSEYAPEGGIHAGVPGRKLPGTVFLARADFMKRKGFL
jgi:oligopeptide transport system ATP-binding protein